MHHAPDARAPRCRQQRQGVFHRLRMGEQPMIEAHPIGIVQNVHSRQRRREPVRLTKSQRTHFHIGAKGIFSAGGIRQRDDPLPFRKQPRRHITTGIAERPGDSVHLVIIYITVFSVFCDIER